MNLKESSVASNTQRVDSGLADIVAAETTLSDVKGEEGRLVIAGYEVEDLAPNASFEQVVYLILHGNLPGTEELRSLKQQLSEYRLPEATKRILTEAAAAGVPIDDALPIGVETLRLGQKGSKDDPLAIIAGLQEIIPLYWRLSRQEVMIENVDDPSAAGRFLHRLFNRKATSDQIRALETYWNTVIDHGLNASTFSARVVISTRSDLIGAVSAALNTLKGPLHGGAPGPALDMVFEIGLEENAEAVIRSKLEAGERLMGFGHRIYKIRDPRADVLSDAAKQLFSSEEDVALYKLAQATESTAHRLLKEYKPGRRLDTNVEFYTALLLHGLQFSKELFTPTFAATRVVGWLAHAAEQLKSQRIVRPASTYVGPINRKFVSR
jgi:citrate synthase